MWPASKVFPKELFPLGRLPVLGHVIREMVEAGIEHVVIVARKGGLPTIEAFLDPGIAPPASVENDDIVRAFSHILRTTKFTLLEQSGPYGNGTPLLNGSPHAGGGACLFAFADDVVFGENVSAGLVSTFQQTGYPILALQSVPQADAGKFGIVEVETVDRSVPLVTRFVEKPRAGETTSTLASFGRYLITPSVLDALREVPLGRANELWLSDAFVRLLEQRSQIGTYALTTGRWYTVGDPSGYKDAVAAATRSDG
jgi:UTP--glucose-1-phosphate uridylyltransferase